MVRIQLQLDEVIYNALHEIAHKQCKSMSAVAREILHSYFTAEKPVKLRTFTFIGSGASGRSDISVRHNEF